MKKVLSFLSIVCFIGFISTVSAQTMPIPKKPTVKTPSISDISTTQMQTLFDTPKTQEKVKD